MDLFDKAAELAQKIKESREYKEFLESKANILGKYHTMEMLKEYRRRQFEMQLAHMTGDDSEENEEEVEALYELMASDPQINQYLTAEYNFTRMMQDVQNILLDGLEVFPEQETVSNNSLYN